MAQLTQIGWVGAGIMGAAICSRLLKAGYSVTVHSRTRARAVGLLEEGAIWADSPKSVAESCDFVGVMVGYPHEVRDVILGPFGVLAGARPGSVVVDFSTSSPALAVEIVGAAGERGVTAIDAPVSGGDVGAREGTLSIMLGGDEGAIERIRPILECFARTIVRQGGPGAGQHTKLVNQILIATNMIGVCEALLYAERSGLDPTVVLRSVSVGAAGSWSLSNLAPRILAGNFDPGFMIEHFVKDLGIAIEEADRMGLRLPGLALAKGLYRRALAEGLGRRGTQALYLVLRDLPSDFVPAAGPEDRG